MAGELAFVYATTNNESVMVDFSSWVHDRNRNPLVLGNVDSKDPPTYAEALYIAVDNGDGTVSVVLDDAAARARSMPIGMTNSVTDLEIAYLAFQDGLGPKPIPRRCGGALFLNTWFGETVPAGKCDDRLAWSAGFCSGGTSAWSDVSGTTAPMNRYMQLTQPNGAYKRAPIDKGSCGVMKTIVSETYVHMWEANYDVPVSPTCVSETDAAFCERRGASLREPQRFRQLRRFS